MDGAEKLKVERDRPQNCNLYRTVLRDCHYDILTDLDPDRMIDCMFATGYIDSIVKNDLQSITVRSEKINKIIRVVERKGPTQFTQFIDMVKFTHSDYLAETLEQRLRVTEPHVGIDYLQRYLIDIYKRDVGWVNPILNDEENLLATMYVTPAVSLIRERDEVNMLKVVKEKSTKPIKLSMNTLLSTRGKLCNNIYATGDAGTGKTTLCGWIVLTWCDAKENDNNTYRSEEMDVMSQFKYVFYINLRHTEEYHVEDMIREQLLSGSPNEVAQIDISKLLQSEKCLIVLDGLDEWHCPVKGKHIPDRKSSHNCSFLTTARNWKFDVISLASKLVDKHIDLCGLEEESSNELVEKMVYYLDKKTGKETQAADFQNYIHQRDLDDVACVPVLLIQLVTLWHFGRDFCKSQLQLYCGMLDLLFECSGKKLHQDTDTDVINVLPDWFDTYDFCRCHARVIHCLSKLAFEGLFNTKREDALVFKSSKMEIFGISPSDINLCLQCGVLSQSKEYGTYTEKNKRFSFLHKKVQEFLAAIHIVTFEQVDDILCRLKEFCMSLETALEMSQVWLFVSGMKPAVASKILSHLNFVVMADEQVQKYRQSLLGYGLIRDIQNCITDCIAEAENNEMPTLTAALSDYFIDEYTVSEVAELLKTTDRNEVKSVCLITDNIPDDSLSSAAECLKYCCELQKIDIFDYESKISCESITDLLQKSYESLKSFRLFFIAVDNSFVSAICRSNCLTALELSLGFRVNHVNKEQLLETVSQRKEMVQLVLQLDCTDHVANQCRPIFNVTSLSKLQRLELRFVTVANLPDMTNCVDDLKLHDVALSETELCAYIHKLAESKREVCVTLNRVYIDRKDQSSELDVVLHRTNGLTIKECKFDCNSDTRTVSFRILKE